MNSKLFLMASLALLSSARATADSIHPVADGAFWHHDSGWVFPEKIGEFVRVGIPQDVAGSKDAVAYYARVVDGLRTSASVDVYPSDSAAEHRAVTGDSFDVGKDHALHGVVSSSAKAAELVREYFVTAGEWRVSIRIVSPQPDTAPLMDAFVLSQRWETLTGPT